jgi:ATP-dependent RNA helicase RhlE
LKQFEALGLFPSILGALDTLGYETPTPIQAQAIPHVLGGRDIMGLAQTGTGKTAAFGLPLIQLLSKGELQRQPKAISALILAPTRELVNQIADNLRGYSKRSHMKIRRAVGGASIGVQIRDLSQGADILVATPGRLIDLTERKAVNIGTAKYLVLDEADQMLDLGFIHALKRIAKMVGTPRQTLLFSATMPEAIAQLAKAFLTDPVRVAVSSPGRTADKVAQFVHFVEQRAKPDLLKALLAKDPAHLSLVFARTKHGAEKLMKTINAAGFSAASIHGNKSQGQRERAIKAFRDGEVRILVATDVAARGIDIPGVSHVYNYDLPHVPESYVHRIGRTARAGKAGDAVAFCAPDERNLLKSIEKLTGIALIPVNENVDLAAKFERQPRPATTTPADQAPRPADRNRPRNRRRKFGNAQMQPAADGRAHKRGGEGTATAPGTPHKKKFRRFRRKQRNAA